MVIRCSKTVTREGDTAYSKLQGLETAGTSPERILSGCDDTWIAVVSEA